MAQPQRPTLGHIVLFTLDRQTADEINKTGVRRQYQAGEQMPGIVVATGGTQAMGTLNLTLFPDGPETYHIENVEGGMGGGNRNRTWTWPHLAEQAA